MLLDAHTPQIPGFDETRPGGASVYDPSSSTSKAGVYLSGLMSLIKESRAGSLQQFHGWVLDQEETTANQIMERYVSKSNFGAKFCKAMEWHSVNQAKKPWREQMECIVEVEGVKYMSIQRRWCVQGMIWDVIILRRSIPLGSGFLVASERVSIGIVSLHINASSSLLYASNSSTRYSARLMDESNLQQNTFSHVDSN